LHRSPPSLCGSLFMLTTTSELSSGHATTTLVPCDTCVNIWRLKRRRHCLQRHLVTDRLLQLTVVWRSCCSRREAAESSKQRRPGHLSAAQMCSRQTAITGSSMAASPTAHPVGYKIAVIMRKTFAVHRWTPTTYANDDTVSAVHRCSASCAVDTHWDSQASVL